MSFGSAIQLVKWGRGGENHREKQSSGIPRSCPQMGTRPLNALHFLPAPLPMGEIC